MYTYKYAYQTLQLSDRGCHHPATEDTYTDYMYM